MIGCLLSTKSRPRRFWRTSKRRGPANTLVSPLNYRWSHLWNFILIQETGTEQHIVAMRDYWIKQLKQRPGNAVVPVKSAKDPKPRKTGKAPHHIETFGNSDDELTNAEQRGGKSFVTVRGHDPKVPGASTLLSSSKRSASLDTTSNIGSSHPIWLDPQLHQVNNPGPQTSITPTGQGISTSEAPPPEVPVPSALRSYETVELIALHLACTPNFHQMMRLDGKMSMRSLDKNWLCGLDLPERQYRNLRMTPRGWHTISVAITMRPSKDERQKSLNNFQK
jgi:hypothetical protein